eukprot:GEMP01098579.1.p1 GENE.GEMP01098579.1~~GEMP01098579.1.p1  ORF type:complete len:136 (+),score=23.51 GEMP01098579.1:23-430(+)
MSRDSRVLFAPNGIAGGAVLRLLNEQLELCDSSIMVGCSKGHVYDIMRGAHNGEIDEKWQRVQMKYLTSESIFPWLATFPSEPLVCINLSAIAPERTIEAYALAQQQASRFIGLEEDASLKDQLGIIFDSVEDVV